MSAGLSDDGDIIRGALAGARLRLLLHGS
jgi:hypothetical protein